MEAEEDGLVSENDEDEMARDIEDSEEEELPSGKGKSKGRVVGEFSCIIYNEDEEEMAISRQRRYFRKF
jgi:hypothetical protein